MRAQDSRRASGPCQNHYADSRRDHPTDLTLDRELVAGPVRVKSPILCNSALALWLGSELAQRLVGLGIDIADLERDHFRDAQPSAPRVRPLAGPRTGSGGGERCLVLRCRCRAQQQCHLLDAEHRGYPPRVRHDGEPARQVRPPPEGENYSGASLTPSSARSG